MPFYRVHLHTGASMTVLVDADDESYAIEQAYDNDQYLCASCSGHGQSFSLDLGEWEIDENPDGTPDIDVI